MSGMRAARGLGVALMLAGALAAMPARAAAPAGRVVVVEPSRTDSTLECTVLTAGLPDGPSRETLESGLPSALTLSIAMLDARGRERGGADVEVRIEPDPWERVLVVRTPAGRTRVAGLDELAGALRRLGPFPVAHLRAADVGAPLRLRVRLTVHALAPAEADRAHALFAGDLSGNGADRREVSAGLGSLLRFFLGRTPASPWQSEAVSVPFDARALARGR